MSDAPRPLRPSSPGIRRRARSRRRIGALAALIVALVPLTVAAAEFVTGETVVISAPVTGDLYVFGNDIVIQNSVDGDLIAFGARVRVFGAVSGDVYAAAWDVLVAGGAGDSVIAAGATVEVQGDIGHATRAVADELTLSAATVAGDLVAAANTVRLDRASAIDGDVALRSDAARIDGGIGGALRGRITDLRVGGVARGPIDVRVETLRFTDGARVSGPIVYTSDQMMLVDGGTMLPPDAIRVEPDHPTVAERSQRSIVFAAFRYSWALALALVLLRVMPGTLRGVADTLRDRPAGSLGWGLLATIVIPLMIAFMLVSVVAIPIALVALALWLFILYASQIVVAVVLGDLLVDVTGRDARRGQASTLALGLAVVVTLRSLPLDGWYIVVAFATAVLGLGAACLHGRALLQRRAAGAAAPVG